MGKNKKREKVMMTIKHRLNKLERIINTKANKEDVKLIITIVGPGKLEEKNFDNVIGAGLWESKELFELKRLSGETFADFDNRLQNKVQEYCEKNRDIPRIFYRLKRTDEVTEKEKGTGLITEFEDLIID